MDGDENELIEQIVNKEWSQEPEYPRVPYTAFEMSQNDAAHIQTKSQVDQTEYHAESSLHNLASFLFVLGVVWLLKQKLKEDIGNWHIENSEKGDDYFLGWSVRFLFFPKKTN